MAVLGLFAAVAWVMALTSRHGLEPGANVLVNRPRLIDANNSPTVARNPQRPRNVVVTQRVDRPFFTSYLHWSVDEGRSWRHTQLPLPDGLDRPFAPDVAFAPDGTLYVSYVNLVGDGNVPDHLWVARSTDGGRTLSDPVRVAGKFSFQARLAVGPDGTVYVTWLQAKSVGLFKLSDRPNPIVLSKSGDKGMTFSPPVPVSDPARERVAAASPVVDRKGRVLVLYEDFKGDRRDFEFLEGPPAEEPFTLVLTRSNDGGETFSPGVDVESGVVARRRFMVFLPEFPSLALGPKRSLVVAWADGRNGDEDVFVRRSDDLGRTWTPPLRVNDNPKGDGTDQYLPRVAVAPSGRIDVLFLDRRHDRRNVMTETFLASSTDGRTFRNVAVSSEAFDSRAGPFIDQMFPIDFGSRIGLVSDDRGALAAWTDTRHGSEDTGRQDIVFARVSEAGASAAEWAGVAALTVLGLLVGGWALKRPAPPADGADPTRGPAAEAVAGPRETV